MLGRLKDAAKSWVAGLFIGLLVLSFAVWGIGDIFLGTNNTHVAEVGGTPIPSAEFERRFRIQVQQLSAQTDGVFDTLQARRLGLDQQVLAGLIQTTALNVAGQDLGLTVSDETLAMTIKNDPAFSGTFGSFSQQTYDQLLASNGLTRQSYEESLRHDMARTQLLDTIVAGPVASRRMAEAIFAYRTERRVIDYLVIPPETAGQIEEPTRTDLEEYYDSNSARFTAPEYRSFTYLLVEAADFRDKVEVAEEDIKAQYDFDIARFTVPERRTIQVVYFDNEEAVAQAQKDMADGLSFDGLIASRNLSLDEITRDNVTQAEMIDQPLAEATFQLALGEISGPIEGLVNFALARVTNISEGRVQPYEEAREILRDEMIGNLATNALFDFSGEIEDALAGNATLEETATALGINAVTVRSVNRAGTNKGDRQPDQLPDDDVALDAILTEVFRSDIGFAGDLLPTEQDGYFVVRVDDVTPSAVKPFDSIVEEVRTALLNVRRAAKLEEFAKNVAERAMGGATFESLANEIGRTVLSTSPDIGREDNDETLSPELITDAFAADIGDFVSGPTGFGESWVVATPREAILQSVSENAAQIESLVEQLGQSSVQDLGDQYVSALQDRLGVETFPDVIDTTLGGTIN